MEKNKNPWEEFKLRETKAIVFEEYNSILTEFSKSSTNHLYVSFIADDIVEKLTLLDSKDLEEKIKQAKSALDIMTHIENDFKLNLTLEKNLASSIWEASLIKLLKINSAFSFHDIFKDYVINLYSPFNNQIFLNDCSTFHGILKYLKRHPEKWSEVPKILLDPQVREYEYYNLLKFKFYSSLCARFKSICKNNHEKMMPKRTEGNISVYQFGKQGQFKVVYEDSEDQLEVFLFDFNVFLSQNILFTPIQLISVFVDSKLREVSLNFDYFGINLNEFIKSLNKRKYNLENSQILFILKLIAQAAVDLLNHKIFIEMLHPYNIYLLKNKISIIPKSYFGRFLEFNDLDLKVFKSLRYNGEIEKSLSYSLGVIFLYFKDQNIKVSDFNGQKEKILKNCDSGTRNFIESLIGSNEGINIRQVLEIL